MNLKGLKVVAPHLVFRFCGTGGVWLFLCFVTWGHESLLFRNFNHAAFERHHFLGHEVGEGGVQFVGVQMEADELGEVVGLPVAEQAEDFFFGEAQAVFAQKVVAVGQTYVTLSAVVAAQLAEVAQQLAAAALVVVLGVVDDGIDAVGVLLFALFIDRWRNEQLATVVAGLRVGDVGRFLAWNEVQDVPFVQSRKHEVGLWQGESYLLGEERFVNEHVVGEHAAIVAQQYDDEFVLYLCEAVEPVEFFAVDEEMHTRAVFRFLGIVDVAGAGENLQRAVYLDGEVLEVVAELVDVEFERASHGAAHAYLVEIGQMVIDLPHVFFVGEGVGDAFVQLAFVAAVVEHCAERRFSVASCASRFLEIGLERVGAVDVYHHAHVGFVDAHAEGVGGHHHAHLVVLPVALSLVFGGAVESGVIEGGVLVVLVEHVGNLLGASAAAHIDDGAARMGVEQLQQVGELVGGKEHLVGQVFPLVAHSEYLEGSGA